jgi:hypothetical protein
MITLAAAATSVPSLLIIGSLIIIWGTLLVAMGLTESYKEIKWRENVNALGTLAILGGTLFALIGTTEGDINHTDKMILLWGMGIIAATDVFGLLAPRVAKQWREKRQNNKRDGNSVNA